VSNKLVFSSAAEEEIAKQFPTEAGAVASSKVFDFACGSDNY
jgi:hypothetical protein